MKDRILNILKEEERAYTAIELKDILGLNTTEEVEEMLKVLNELESNLTIYHTNKDKYMAFCYSHLKKGKISVSDKGFGFVLMEGEDDIHVDAKHLNGAIDGDMVIVEITNKNTGSKKEGRVLRIASRNYGPIVGEFKFIDDMPTIIPNDKKFKQKIVLTKESTKDCVEGHIVVANVVKELDRNTVLAEITTIIGHKNDVGVDILSFVYEYNFNPEFPKEVIDELESIPQFLSSNDINEGLTSGRRDLRDEIIFTIDGADTKDIDDAVSIEKISDNEYILGVHIADVSYYVKEGTKIDEEAYFRGTSVYLVDRVLPMLPHKLSNGICSLNENEDRFAMSCIMHIDSKGNVTKYEITPSIIRSRKKMTYDNVNLILEDNIIPDGYEKFADTLIVMEELSKILRKKMINRGYIEFESDEAKIIVDDACHPIDIKAREQRTGEQLIENFMIVANETVAGSIFYKNLPGIYRVHDKPNEKRIEEFIKFLSLHGYTPVGKSKIETPKDLQKILNSLENVPEVKVLHDMAIRSQAKAVYSDVNIGHFGLGSKCYSHFTSPIRRYPDLILHRLIREYNYNYSEDIINKNKEYLPVATEHLSIREQEAQNCERDVDKMKKAEYMMDHIGEVYEGIISGVQEFGFFVELDNTVEGLVRVEDIKGDYFIYNPDLMALLGKRSKRKYAFGDKVVVKVVSADKDKSTIDFEIYEEVKNKKNKKNDTKK